MQTVIGAFDTTEQAERASQDLLKAGVAWADISLIANNEGGRYAANAGTTAEGVSMTGHAVGHDAIIGAEWGAGVGFLFGLTGLAIPGLGWIAGAGWLMGTLLGAGTGALVGGLVGALTHVGVPEAEAVRYNEAVRSGRVLLKALFHRPRPEVVFDNLGYSFPSGHSFFALVVYGMLAYWLTRDMPINRRGTTWTVAILAIFLVGFSRVFLGEHYPSDVAAGFAVAVPWLWGCLALPTLFHRRRQRSSRGVIAKAGKSQDGED